MTRIKHSDVSPYETDSGKIAEHLRKVLKDIRKKKLALDLIGDDERSGEFDISKFDLFADELSQGVELTYIDEKRINARATALAQRRMFTATKREE